MVNHIKRRMQREQKAAGPQGNVFVRFISTDTEVVGNQVFEPGAKGWIEWRMAERLRDEGKVTILQYDQDLLDAICAGLTPDRVDEARGLVCTDCLAVGVVRAFRDKRTLHMHKVNAHNYRKGQDASGKHKGRKSGRKGRS